LETLTFKNVDSTSNAIGLEPKLKNEIAMASTPSKDYKRLEREQKKREKRMAREEARAEKLRLAQEAEKKAAEEAELEALERATRPDGQ